MIRSTPNCWGCAGDWFGALWPRVAEATGMRRVINEADIWPPSSSSRRRRRTTRIERLLRLLQRALPSPDPLDWQGAADRASREVAAMPPKGGWRPSARHCWHGPLSLRPFQPSPEANKWSPTRRHQPLHPTTQREGHGESARQSNIGGIEQDWNGRGRENFKTRCLKPFAQESFLSRCASRNTPTS